MDRRNATGQQHDRRPDTCGHRDTREPKSTQRSQRSILGSCSLSRIETKGFEDLSQEVKQAIEQAITETLPTGTGMRHRKIFELARALKAIAELDGSPADFLKPVIKDWHRRARDVIHTKDFLDTWVDFDGAWRGVKYPRGNVLRKFWESAEIEPQPKDTSTLADYDYGPRVYALCRDLQKHHGEEPFFLGCRKLGEVAGISPAQANLVLRGLEADKHLVRVSTGDLKSRNASEFFYRGPLE